MSINCENTYRTPCPPGCGRCGLPYDKRPGVKCWRVRGENRFAGIGPMRPFQIHVYRATEAQARTAARLARLEAGYRDVLVLSTATVNARPREPQTLAESDGLRGLIHPEGNPHA